MSLPVEINPHFLGSSGGYEIAQSLRFNSADSADLERTFGTPTDNNRCTLSVWIKKTTNSFNALDFGLLTTGANMSVVGISGTGAYGASLDNKIFIRNNDTNRDYWYPRLRDNSAWYHIVVAINTDESTQANRAKLWINGVSQAENKEASGFSLSEALTFNAASTLHRIGSIGAYSSYYANGYLAEYYFIDGQALDASYFGETNAATGIWQPIEYTGTYGNNGFYLPFTDDDLFFSSGSGGQFTTTSNNSISRTTGNDTSGILSGVTISGDFDIYWKYGTASGSLTPGDAYVVGVAAASYQSSYNYNDNKLGAAANTVFYTQYGASGFYTGAYVSGSQTDTLTSGTNPSTTSYVRISRSGSTVSVHQGATPGSWTLIKTFTGTFSSDVIWFFGSGNKDQNISLNNITFNNVNGVSTIDLIGIGADASGNGNNWFSKNISSVPGAGNDSLVDSPTSYGTDTGAGGEVRGNYATLNPVASITTPPTFANGNLEVTGPSSGVGATQSTFGASGGKFYVEVTVTRVSDRLDLGIVGSLTASTFMTSTNYLGTDTNTIGYGTSTGVIRKDNTNNQTGLVTCTTGDVVGMAIDMDSGTIQFYKNNSTVGTAVSFTPSAYGSFLIAQTTSYNTSKGTYNFGQRPFAYTAPSGFKCLVVTNLEEPDIVDSGDYFNVKLWPGTGSTQSITGIGFQPDLVWSKDRGALYDHTLFDAVRGATKFLRSNETSAEETQADSLTSFNADGFSVGADAVRNNINKSSASYVSWTWKANGSGVTNPDGNISSTISANPTAGFSIITHTGTGSNGTLGHGLGVVPKFVLTKRRSSSEAWTGWHTGLSGGTYNIELDNTNGEQSSPTHYTALPTSTVLNLGTNTASNYSGSTYVTYAFASIEGYSAFGKYTGNGSADGPFIYLGFRPKYWLVKKISDIDCWAIHDTSRDPYNVSDTFLQANDAAADTNGTGGAYFDILSNGIKVRTSSNQVNTSSGTYIYAAWAENPFKYARAR